MAFFSRNNLTDPFADIQAATRKHRSAHGCLAYTFEDGESLQRLSADRRPSRILELGTALGYTACCLAHGSPNAKLDTIEGDAEHARLAREHIEQHGLSDRITVHHGWFDEVLPRLKTGYDLIFFDGYAPPPATIRQLRELLNSGGLLVCSNVQLAGQEEFRALRTELDDATRWDALPGIEHGRTWLRVKRHV